MKRDRRSPHRPPRPASQSRSHRFVGRDGRVNVTRQGLSFRRPHDWYHWMLTLKWHQLIGIVVLLYLALNSFFALLYLLDAEGLRGARPGNFIDAFFFSVYTFATLGYNTVAPHSFYANVIVTLETLIGLCGFGLITGVLFSRLSRPSARVMFSHYAVVAPHEGVPTLIFRAANRRGNQILQAQVHVSLSRNEKTLEGESVRRVYDLRLLRSASSFFNLMWTMRHPIDEQSPLYGETPDSLRESETEIVVLLSGVDDVYGQTVYGQFSFNHEEILYGYRFKTMFDRDEHNRPVVDYALFDAVETVSKKEEADGITAATEEHETHHAHA